MGEIKYRYRLTRRWDDGPTALFVMLNPSTADASEDDPTIRKCIGFAKRLGRPAIEVVNLFALRATKPAELKRHAAPIGPENDDHIRASAAAADLIICAWGRGGRLRNRDLNVLRQLRALGGKLSALEVTKDGSPAHPLMLGYDRDLVAYD